MLNVAAILLLGINLLIAYRSGNTLLEFTARWFQGGGTSQVLWSYGVCTLFAIVLAWWLFLANWMTVAIATSIQFMDEAIEERHLFDMPLCYSVISLIVMLSVSGMHALQAMFF